MAILNNIYIFVSWIFKLYTSFFVVTRTTELNEHLNRQWDTTNLSPCWMNKDIPCLNKNKKIHWDSYCVLFSHSGISSCVILQYINKFIHLYLDFHSPKKHHQQINIHLKFTTRYHATRNKQKYFQYFLNTIPVNKTKRVGLF